MKIAISCLGQTLDDKMDQRFGRAAFFLIVDSETLNFSVIDNAAQAASGGAGIAAAQSLLDVQIEAVITGQVGPNAMNVLKASDIPIYQGTADSALANIQAFQAGKLSIIANSGPSHFGMGQRGGRA